MTELERQRAALDLFVRLCDLPRDQQPNELDRLCDGDDSLRGEVRKLLSIDESDTRILNESKVNAFLHEQMSEISGPSPDEALSAGGSYRILRVIGEGGMGTVYEAEQQSPRRRVAIKAIRPGRLSAQTRKRFEYEAQVLARLEHPNIARLYESDTEVKPGGVVAFLAMELVVGEPIDEYARSRSMDVRQKLCLFVQVCRAIEYAHRMGVIHRDLKPANILVTRDGQPKVLDFGVAQTFGDDKLMSTMLTQHGQIVGTLQYMSPEQMDGKGVVDTRADVYSLGVVLFRVLTGAMPIDLSDSSLAAATQRVLHEPPARLSSFDRRLGGDLETILACALEKDPARRYAGVEQFSGDIERYLDGRPIQARADSPAYVLRKTLWRYRKSVAAAVVLVWLLAAFALIASMQARTNKHLADEATRQADQLRRSLYFSNIGFAQAALQANDSHQARVHLSACPPELRNWEWDYLNEQVDTSDGPVKLAASTGDGMVLSADARFVATIAGSTVSICDSATGALLRKHEVESGNPEVDISADGAKYCYGTSTGGLICRDMLTAGVLWNDKSIGENQPLRSIHFAEAAPVLAVVAVDGTVQVRDSSTGQVRNQVRIENAPLSEFVLSRDGKTCYVIDSAGKASSWDLSTGERSGEFDDGEFHAHSLSVNADSTLLLVKTVAGPVLLWDVPGHRIERRFDPPVGVGLTIFSHDGVSFFGVCTDYVIRKWSLTQAVLPEVYRGSEDWTQSLAASADGRYLTTAASDGTIRRWTLHRQGNYRWLSCGTGALAVAFSTDGRRVLALDEHGRVHAWDRRTLAPLPGPQDGDELTLRAARNRTTASSADGGTTATASSNGTIELKPTDGRTAPRLLVAHKQAVTGVAFMPDSQRLVSVGHDRVVRIWDVRSGEEVVALREGGYDLCGVDTSPDGNEIAACTTLGMVNLWRKGLDQERPAR